MALKLMFQEEQPLLLPQKVLVESKTTTIRRVGSNNRVHWVFGDGTVFKQTKEQIIKEIEETLDLLGMDRITLARKMNVQASAVTQSLAADRGLQLSTLVRIADALECDVEVNLIRRGPHSI